MSWIKTASTSALAAGAILLSAGCTSKKDVAMAAKDDTIRRQEQSIRDTEAARAAADNQARVAEEQQRVAADQARQAAELNRQLADQNSQVIDRSAKLTAANIEASNASAQRISQLQNQVSDLDRDVKGLGKFAATSPNTPCPPGMDGTMSKHPDGSIHISVAGSVLFDSGRAELRSGANDTLMRAASTIRSSYPNNAIRIEGHTDSTPVVHSRDRFPDNMALSQARAAAVYDFLCKRGGLSPSRMYTAGYGDRQPLVPERCAADRAKNRRVEIVILPTNLNVHKEHLTHAEIPGKSNQARVVAASAPVPAQK